MELANASLLWFREDLRLHDNQSLVEANRSARQMIPVYIFDERVFKGKTRRFGFPKTGAHRAQFIIEAVTDLRASLRAKGSDLIVRVGKPEEVLFQFAREYKTSFVFCNRERTEEEVKVQDGLEENLWSVGQEMRYARGKMLYYTADLPFPVNHTPDTFTQFRKEVERFVPVREPLSIPEAITALPIGIEPGDIPTLADFGLSPIEKDERAVLDIVGGETAGLARLQDYFRNTNAASKYKETRNNLLGANYSTKFSMWLAHGCLSPKMIYKELKQYEKDKTSNKSTYWIFFELLWRDFFRLMAKKHGKNIFLAGGTRSESIEGLSNNSRLMEIWEQGKTGIPFIDANMRELSLTGFMSNRGRQNVASFLVKDLKVNWQMGAEYFESTLIDYDPASNWGNWNYIAGVGSDPRENRYFNILKQAKRYDSNGDFVKHWLPELKAIPSEKIHRPDLLSTEEQEMYGVKLGALYPKAMLRIDKWD